MEDNIKKNYKISNIIENPNNFHAHIYNDNSEIYETLEQHTSLTYDYCIKIIKFKKLDITIKTLISKILELKKINSPKMVDFIYKMFLLAVYYHDIGKINPMFQIEVMKNSNFINDKNENYSSFHSIYSCIIYYFIAISEYKKIPNTRMFGQCVKQMLVLFAYVISRHHSKLDDVNESVILYERLFSKVYNDSEELKYALKYLKFDVNGNKNIYNCINFTDVSNEMYLLIKLLNSLIITSDYYATYEFMKHEKLEINTIENIDKIIDVYKNSELYLKIQNYKKNKNCFNDIKINALRSDMFIEAENNLDNKSNFYYLEVPTGGGKTNISINLTLKLLKNNSSLQKIFYVFPFNTLIEQTKDFLNNDAFQNKVKIGIINSEETPDVDEEETNYREHWNINNTMYNYNFILISHVRLFSTLFGTGKESQFGLVHLANSVIILDEIQSYKNKLWDKIINMLNLYSKYLNIKFIIMSATLPKLNVLSLDKDVKIKYLISDSKKYFDAPLFKDRVKINFDLLNIDKISLDDILNKILELYKSGYKKLLVEFISKKTSHEFYNNLINTELDNECKLYEITGDDSSYFKKIMIDDIKKLDKVIVVSTQTIEAGVDLDFEAGLKDVSILDSEEQFLGRINRSCKKENSIAYFFDYDKKYIYNGDKRLNYSISSSNKDYQKSRKMLVNKSFDEYYYKVLDDLKYVSNKLNENGIDNFNSNVSTLKFNKVCNELKLIDDIQGYDIFVNCDIKLNDGKIIKGKDVWEKLRSIYLYNSDYSCKKYELQKMMKYVYIFTHKIVEYENGKIKIKPENFDCNLGSLYYISDGEQYMYEENGIKKFNFDKYKNNNGLFY